MTNNNSNNSKQQQQQKYGNNTNNILEIDEHDYYRILNVPYNADYKMIRKAYLKLSLQYHPDKNTSSSDPVSENIAQESFVRIGRAYQTLSNPQERKVYDQTYHLRYGSSNNYKNSTKTSYNNNNNSNNNTTRPQYQKQSSFARDFYNSATNASSNNNNNNNSNHNAPYTQHNNNNSSNNPNQDQYETYRNFFDQTMADLSDDELNEVLGATAMFASLIGGIIGAKLLGSSSSTTGKGGGGGGLISKSLGSAIGSAIASHAATTIVKQSHAQAKQRTAALNYKNPDPSIRHQQQQQQQQNSNNTRSSTRKEATTIPTNNAKDDDSNNHWKEIIDNVMCGPIGQHAGTVIQQVVNDFINKPNSNKSNTKY